jgi:hypothetical protein
MEIWGQMRRSERRSMRAGAAAGKVQRELRAGWVS